LANLLKTAIFRSQKSGSKEIGLYGYLRIRQDPNTFSTTIYPATLGQKVHQSPEQQGCPQRLLIDPAH
jgi:hypothetical protein